MRPTTLLAAFALTTLAFATPVSAASDVQDGPDLISFGSPCLNGGITLIVYGVTVLQCWKPAGADAEETVVMCASEVCFPILEYPRELAARIRAKAYSFRLPDPR